MEAIDIILWAVLPYVTIFLFIVGMIWRWRYDQYGWTTRSSQSYESVWLRLASPLFHFGILFVAFGHFLGLMIPKTWTRALGLSDTVYHWVATIPGTIAGLMTIVGLALLIIRRRTYGDVFRATTTNDKIMYVFLAVPILLGTAATLINQVFTTSHGYDYRETISPWLRNLFIFNPQPELMTDVPLSFQMHVVAGFLLFAIWPFTRLVHAFSAPIGYSTRPDIVYRSRQKTISTQAPKRGWEPVDFSGGRPKR